MQQREATRLVSTVTRQRREHALLGHDRRLGGTSLGDAGGAGTLGKG